MKKLIYLLLALLALVVGLTFTVKNPQTVAVNYYFGLVWEGPLSVVVLVSLAIGVAIGYIVILLQTLPLRVQLARFRRQGRKTPPESSETGLTPTPPS